jgi:ribonuclease III
MHETLEETSGIHFENTSLLQQALIHRSYIYESAGEGLSSNERLEFLGDSILAFISADYLFRTFPELNEGDLSDLRAALVRRETLATFAQEINLGNFLLMGKGEQSSGVSQRVLASAFEAVLGALFLDRGIKTVQWFLKPRLEPLAQNIVSKRLFKDQKSLFQEQAQAQVGITPTYRLVSHEGPSHNREFTVEVLLGDEVAGSGQGRNKQAAEQEAAHAALLNRGWI